MTPHAWFLAALLAGLISGITAAFLLELQRRPGARGRPAPGPHAPADESDLSTVSALTAGLAHEIKNPLSTIGLNAQLLAERTRELPVPEEDQRPILTRIDAIRREADRLAETLEDFLRYAGEIHLAAQPTDLNAIADDLADFFSPHARQLGITLRCDLAQGPLTASVDQDQLKQAVLNLLLNAAQAISSAAKNTPQPDDRPASARPPAGEIYLRTSRAGKNRLALHVIDTGPGIPADTTQRIFQPYFTTKPAGTGLGLPLTKRIIEAHGGSIELFSEQGRGTDFTITLPAAQPSRDDAPAEHKPLRRDDLEPHA